MFLCIKYSGASLYCCCTNAWLLLTDGWDVVHPPTLLSITSDCDCPVPRIDKEQTLFGCHNAQNLIFASFLSMTAIAAKHKHRRDASSALQYRYNNHRNHLYCVVDCFLSRRISFWLPRSAQQEQLQVFLQSRVRLYWTLINLCNVKDTGLGATTVVLVVCGLNLQSRKLKAAIPGPKSE